MDGQKVKDYLKRQGVTATSLAEALGISKQLMSSWLKSGLLNQGQRSQIVEALELPANFFDQSVNQIGEGNVANAASAELAACQTRCAVLEEKVRGLEIRLRDKEKEIKRLTDRRK